MHLETLKVRNFRAIDSIDVQFRDGINVIVGPNAVGKTTVLESIRLVKSLLSSRTPNEANQMLISLGAVAPHRPQQLIESALVRDAGKPLEIGCIFKLTASEIDRIIGNLALVTTSLVRSRFNSNIDNASFSSYISSTEGQNTLESAHKEVSVSANRLRDSGGICQVSLNIDFRAGRINSADSVNAHFIGYLDSSLSPARTVFSYFPADRALPRGEQPIQLGSQDAQQVIESHNSQPQIKYVRLKNVVFSSILSGENGHQNIKLEFEKIFSGLLKGKELVGASINEWGMLSTIIKDIDSGRNFDIDAMSSGEKGLILTFLLISQSIEDNGMVLLDEPELHLESV